MPRGQYDRSLTKEQRAVLKAAAMKAAGVNGAVPAPPKTAAKVKAVKAVKAKRTWTRRAPQAGLQTTSKTGSGSESPIYTLQCLQAYLLSLAQVSGQLGADAPETIETEIIATLEVARDLRQSVYGKTKAEKLLDADDELSEDLVASPPAPVAPPQAQQQLRPPPQAQQPFPPVSA